MNSEINMELYNNVINEILPGLTMYVRDVNLPAACADKYKPQTIIMERGFTDASCRVMGMVTTHRYAILSNHMKDFSEFEHGTNWGLFVALNNAHFKVLDVYEYQGHTQILLLHLPDDSRWKLFQNVKLSIEDELIEDSRKRFEKKSSQEPVPELAKEDWLARCSAPIGMNYEGELFDLEPLLRNEMRNIKNEGFRTFYHRFIYIECRNNLEKLMKDFLTEDDTGAIAYGYIDEHAGLSFQIAKLASLKDNRLTIRDSVKKAMMIMRFGSVENEKYLDLSKTDVDISQFAEFEKMIRDNYDTSNPDKERIRSFEFLDTCRHPEYPDDLQVVLLKKGLEPEAVWVNGNHLTENEIYGKLLNEPDADFGVHMGDSIRIIPYKQKDGRIICFSSQDD